MFCIDPQPIFSAPVELSRPGQAEPVQVHINFRHKTDKEFLAWEKTLAARPDIDVLDEVVANWSGFEDQAGRPVPYSRAALDTLLANYPTSSVEIYRAYRRELREGKRKNSSGQPAR